MSDQTQLEAHIPKKEPEKSSLSDHGFIYVRGAIGEINEQVAHTTCLHEGELPG